MAAVVQRVVFAPNFKTQWLSPERVWVDDRMLALYFATYELADAEVAILRMEGEEHAHAAIGEKPTKRAPQLDPLTPPAIRNGYVPKLVRDLEKASRVRCRTGVTEPVIKMDRFREFQCRRDPVETD